VKGLTVKKLLAREEKQLNDWLCSSIQSPNSFNLMELKGYLFGICTTPYLLQPSIWLLPIFGGEPIDLDDDASIKNIELIMRLYNYTNQQIIKQKIKLPFSVEIEADVLAHFQRGNALCDWAFGMDTALQLTMGYWDDIDYSEEDDEFLDMCWMTLTFFADEQRTRENFKKEFKTKKTTAEIIEGFAASLECVANDYAALARDLYIEGLEGGSFFNDDEGLEEQLDFFNDPDTDELSPSEDLMLQAQMAPSRQQAAHLAKQALALDPNNLDIYTFLASCSPNSKDAIHWLVQAVAAGEKVLGESFFIENTGHFWLIHETRSYMEALSELANTYLEANQFARAIECYEKGLVLNPNDNQGLRHILIGAYIRAHELEKADALLNTYEDDLSAFMRFSKLLIRYIQEGDSPAARALKADATAYNKHVPVYLSGKHKIPANLPEYFGIGDKNEAIIYAHVHRDVWRNTMGAIGWLNK
jgi:yecA family protein